VDCGHRHPQSSHETRPSGDLRPDLVRDDRFFAGRFDHATSDDGGRDKFDESAANRRSNSATRCVNTSIVLA
jgi:hypothetical protein